MAMNSKIYSSFSMDFTFEIHHAQRADGLGLSQEALRTKNIFDIGGGDGIILSFYHAGNIVSMDKDRNKYMHPHKHAVSGDALENNFDDESFDYVVSAQGLPNLYASAGYMLKYLKEEGKTIDEVKKPGETFSWDWAKEFLDSEDPADLADEKTEHLFREALRLLVPGGEARFVPIYPDIRGAPWYKEYNEEMIQILKNLQEEIGFEFRFEEVEGWERDTRVQRLIIKKH
jgi:SAM-dependent methyltransferase